MNQVNQHCLPQMRAQQRRTGVEFVVKNMKMKLLRKIYGFNVINACHDSTETVGVNPSRVPEIFL